MAIGDAYRRDPFSLLLDRDKVTSKMPASLGPTSILNRRLVIATWRSNLAFQYSVDPSATYLKEYPLKMEA